MQVRQTIETVLEFVRGHTGLRGEISRWGTNLGENAGMRRFYAATEPERTDTTLSVASFLMETVWIEATAYAALGAGEAVGHEILQSDDGRLAQDILEDPNTGLAKAMCRIAYIMPGGQQGGALKTFLFRNGLIHRVY